MKVWFGVRDPREANEVEHELIEMLVVAVCAVQPGADGFVESQFVLNLLRTAPGRPQRWPPGPVPYCRRL